MEKQQRLDQKHLKLSKFLSLLLRHRPARFPIPLDNEGYADLNEIMRILNGLPNFRWATRSDVEAVVECPGRRRFEIEGERIRALYGHSAFGPTYEPVEPPDTLYHGTTPESLEGIERDGLRPMRRQYVHLAMTTELAHSIALRHTHEPVILVIDAGRAHADGIEFYHPVKEIYLCEHVPAEYVTQDG